MNLRHKCSWLTCPSLATGKQMKEMIFLTSKTFRECPWFDDIATYSITVYRCYNTIP